jgi:hypothetical protein
MTSDFVIQDLVLSRPFACMAALICFPDSHDIHQVYKERLFVNNGVEFSPTQLSQIMISATLPTVGVGLGVNSYRHISKAFKTKLCNASVEILEEAEEETVDAAQAGRTRKTGDRIYGVSHDTLADIPEDVLPLFLDSSTDWQKELHVVPGGLGLPYHACRAENFVPLVKLGVIKHKMHSRQKTHGTVDIDDLVSKVMERLAPAMKEMMDEAVEKLATCLQHSGMHAASHAF